MTATDIIDLSQPSAALDRPFSPERTAFEIAKQQAAIDMATRLGAWDELDVAVDMLIANQIAFIGWWNANVRRKGGTGGWQSDIAELRYRAEEAERFSGITLKRVSRWRKTLGVTEKEPSGVPELIDRYAAMVEAGARKKAGLVEADNHRAHGTGLDEWFTPESYVEKARFVLGAIDLDPASHPIAQEWIGAEKFFTAEDDALTQEWRGRVWLNPPYSRDLIAKFVDKLMLEIMSLKVPAAIVLTHAYTDTSWWQQLAHLSPVIAFPKGRIRFVNDVGQPCNPTQGQTFFGCGAELDIDLFRNEFAHIGTVRGR